VNVSDSIQSRGSLNPYQQRAMQNAQNNGQTNVKPTGSTSSVNQTRLDALKAKMQSGEPVNLQSLADSMLKKGAFIDTQA
jgi:hypothetical protein